MAQYGFTSPGAEASNAIQAFLMQRALQQRQQMLDASARSDKADASRRADAELDLRNRDEARLTAGQDDERRFRRATAAAQVLQPGQTVDDDTRTMLADQGFGGLVRKVPGIVTQGAQTGTDDTGVPQYDVSSSPDTYRAIAPAAKRVSVKTVDAHGRPLERSVTEDELVAGVPLFDEAKGPAGFTLSPGETRYDDKGQVLARVPGIIASPKDNPALPHGVEDYLGSMRRSGYTSDQAQTELARTWNTLRRDHPNVSSVAVQGALAKLWPTDPLTGLPSVVNVNAGATAQPGRAGGAGPAAGRKATAADVAKVAQTLGISPAEAQKHLEARGVVIR